MNNRFRFCVAFFPETSHYAVLDRNIISGKIIVGKTLKLQFPIRREPFEAVIKQLCHSKEEAENISQALFDGNYTEDSNGAEERSCSWSPEPHKNDDSPKNHQNYVTSDLFCDVMNRVVEVLKEMQNSSCIRLEAAIKEMSKINEKLSMDEKPVEESLEDKDGEDESAPKSKIPISNRPAQKVVPVRPMPANSASRWPPTAGGQSTNIEDDSTGPSWEFVSREKVDEVFEDCENYKIFARKISYAIFDEHEQKQKMNERNKKKVSELRKIIRLKYPSERREFDDMIWRTCKNAVNNTTYNEAKRRKRHPALMLGTDPSQNYLSGSFEHNETVSTPSKRPYDGEHDSHTKSEPSSEFTEH